MIIKRFKLPKFIKAMPIKSRFTFAVLVVVFGVMSIVGYLQIQTTSEEIDTAMHANIDTTSKLAAISLSDPLWNFNDNGLRSICDALFNDRDVGLVIVITANGREIYQKNNVNDQIYDVTRLTIVDRPIVKNTTLLGTVRIGFTNYYNQISLQKEIVTIVVSILIMSFILWFLIAFISSMVTKPIYELSTGTEEIAKGNLTKRLEIDYEDEIGGLARKFNNMAENLAGMMRELEIKNNSLQIEINERQQAQNALAASEEKFFKAFRHVADIIGIVRFSDGRYIEVNDAFHHVLGYSREDVIEHTSQEFGLWHSFEAYMNNLELLKTSGYFRDLEVIWRCKSGELRIGLDSAEVIEIGGELCIVYVWHDITELKQTEKELRYLSMHDMLTEVYNRNYFEQELKQRQKYPCSSVGIIVCDLDGLKLINDTLGHEFGDQMLANAAGIIKSCCDEPHFVARIGGDEFAIVIKDAPESSIQSICEKIRQRVDIYNQSNQEYPLSLSMGYAFSSEPATAIRELYKEADNNMYREKLHRSQSAHSAIVHTVMKLLEARDLITEEHAERLQDIVSALGQAIGLAEGKVADLRLLAQFHDIGKVGVPDNILFKPSSLTPEETYEMRRHCEIGHRIAVASPDLSLIADWILKHHEWWNGKGYPLNLSGEDIPLECRILAIADAYDAMTSNRPYRKALSYEQAIDELKRCAGIQFDPYLVEKFCEIKV